MTISVMVSGEGVNISSECIDAARIEMNDKAVTLPATIAVCIKATSKNFQLANRIT